MNAGKQVPIWRKIRVLIADDSAVVRSLLQAILEAEPRIEVAGTARNGREALEAFERLQPDLVLLDVEMPEMNGLEALSIIRKHDRKTPVIMCSTLTQRGVQTTIEALARGATDYISKRGANSKLDQAEPSLEQQLVPKILGLFPEPPAVVIPIHESPRSLARPPDISLPGLELVVIGVSTGGPAALEVLLPQIPANFPVAMLVVQHMPQRFTEQLAERLNSLCALEVREAAEGVTPRPGIVHIARGDWHLELMRDFRLHLHRNEIPGFCRPSVDLLFRSASIACGGHLLGVMLTGMGSDGLQGCRAIRAAGGAIFAQDNASSVVWGMPGSVVNAGLANKIVALNAMAGEIVRFVSASVSDKRAVGAIGS